MNQNGFTNLVISAVILGLIAISGGIYYFIYLPTKFSSSIPSQTSIIQPTITPLLTITPTPAKKVITPTIHLTPTPKTTTVTPIPTSNSPTSTNTPTSSTPTPTPPPASLMEFNPHQAYAGENMKIFGSYLGTSAGQVIFKGTLNGNSTGDFNAQVLDWTTINITVKIPTGNYDSARLTVITHDNQTLTLTDNSLNNFTFVRYGYPN